MSVISGSGPGCRASALTRLAWLAPMLAVAVVLLGVAGVRYGAPIVAALVGVVAATMGVAAVMVVPRARRLATDREQLARETGAALAAAGSADAVYTAAVAGLCGFMRRERSGYRAFITVGDADRQTVVAVSSPDGYPVPGAVISTATLPAAIRPVVMTPCPVADDNVDRRFLASLLGASADPALRAISAVPLVVEGRVAGTFGVTAAYPIPAAIAEDMAALGVMVALALGRVNANAAFSRLLDEQHSIREEAHQRSMHDPLTRLANRELFKDRVDVALARARRSGIAPTVLLIDIDDFKIINDARGHAVGDALLVAIAKRLGTVLRESDTAARLGGDEFAVLLEGTDSAPNGAPAATRILAALRQPCHIQDYTFDIHASIGVARCRGPEDSSETLLRNADVAMYAAKSSGKDRYELFTPPMLEKVARRADLETELDRAIENGDFILHYQPVVSLQSGHIVGVEALVRWMHPTRGMIPPLDFIPLAERTGKIIQLGRWVFETACAQLRSWLDLGHDLTVSINLSPRQFDDPGLVNDICEILERTSVSASSIVIELTETVIMSRSDAVVQSIHRLKELGFQIALDDFGTGYSSFDYLRRFPVDILKIDRSFVSGIGSATGTSVFVNAINRLSHELNISTIAEGIEEAEELTELCRVGIDAGQGFHLFRPERAEAVTARLDTLRAASAASVSDLIVRRLYS